MRLATFLASASLGLLIIGSPAIAQQGQGQGQGQRQRGQRPQPMSPEKAEAAWTWEAKSVANDLQLETEQTERLVKTYVASRKSLSEAVRTAREEAGTRGGQGQGKGRGQGEGQGQGKGQGGAQGQGQGGDGARGGRRMEPGANAELAAAARTELETSLGDFLSPEQSKQAVASLGTFSRQWDAMVNTLAGMELPPEQMLAALEPTRKFTTKLASMRGAGDREAMMQGLRDARETLTSDLAAVLDDAQMEQFEQAMRRRGQRRGGPQDGQQRRRGGGGPPDER